MKLRGLISGVVICAVAYLWAAEEKKCKFTQESLNAYIRDEIVTDCHELDVEWFDAWMEREGVTHEMLANAFEKVVRDNIKVKEPAEKKTELVCAFEYFARYATQERMKLLLWVIDNAVDDLIATEGVRCYYHHLKDRNEFVKNMIPYLEKEDKERRSSRSVIWSYLLEELDGPYRDVIIKLSREGIHNPHGHIYYPDRVLLKVDPNYEKSELRKEAFRKAVENKEFAKQEPSPYAVIKSIYEKLESK